MNKRTTYILLGVVVTVVGGFGVHDALTTTEQERLEAFVEDVTGRVEASRVQAARSRWVDLHRQPVEIRLHGESRLFGAGDDTALTEYADRGLRALTGTSLRVVGGGTDIEGDRADITLTLMGGTGFGMQHANWTLLRHGDDWLVSRLQVGRAAL